MTRDVVFLWIVVGMLGGLMLASLIVPHGLEYGFTHGAGCVTFYDVYGY